MCGLGNERNVLRFPFLCSRLNPSQRLRHCGFRQRLLARVLQDKLVQNVQVVSFSKQVLSLLDFRVPCFAFFWQETLNHITETFHANTQVVPDFRAWLLGPALMKVDDADQLLEDELRLAALAHANEFAPRGQPAQPALPSFTRKSFQGALSLAPGAAFVFFEIGCERSPHRSARQMQRFQPVRQHLDIAQIREGPLLPLGGFPQTPPHRVGINGGKTLGQRAAASQSDAEVVDWVCFQLSSGALMVPQRTLERTLQSTRRR